MRSPACEASAASSSAASIAASRRGASPTRPAESRPVVFRLDPEAMSLYDRQMRRVVEPGIFNVYAGTNSNDLIGTKLEVTGDVFVLAPSTPRFR